VLAPERTRRVFVNRNLRMDQIEVIGFDMDYTLALYNQPRLEALSAACTLDKMIARRGYPESLRHLPYDARLAIRGLVVDRDRGNVLKMGSLRLCRPRVSRDQAAVASREAQALPRAAAADLAVALRLDRHPVCFARSGAVRADR
jgi:hypothetical protein